MHNQNSDDYCSESEGLQSHQAGGTDFAMEEAALQEVADLADHLDAVEETVKRGAVAAARSAERVCRGCGTSIEHKHLNAKHCSNKCRHRANNQRRFGAPFRRDPRNKLRAILAEESGGYYEHPECF